MRQTFGTIKAQFLDLTGNTGSTDTSLLGFFQRSMNMRYQLIQAELGNWKTQKQLTAVTAVNQAYYHNPAGYMNIESGTVMVGSIAYPLQTVDSQFNFDRINELLITTSAIPQFVFPRQDDFGIWPTPQGIFTITLNYSSRDRNMTVDDYSTGTIDLVNNNQVVTGHSTVFTPLMVGRWISAVDDGYWYRISGQTSSTSLTIETSYEGTNISTGAYVIGQSPELPEDTHELLAIGAAADYFMGYRANAQNANYFNNMFYTGDGANGDRTGANVTAGLIGARKRYAERSNSMIIHRNQNNFAGNTKLWATRISS